MFPVKCKELLPIDRIVIRSVAVRGQLGPITVWVSKLPEELPNAHRNATRHNRNNRIDNNNSGNANANATIDFRLHPKYWTKLYEAVHEPSPNQYCSLTLEQPIVLKPGQVRAIYIHSTLPGDQAIVYDNASFYMPRRGFHFGHHHFVEANNDHGPRYSDAIINIYTGRAHVSNEAPFGQVRMMLIDCCDCSL
jgi:hypothetical protein